MFFDFDKTKVPFGSMHEWQIFPSTTTLCPTLLVFSSSLSLSLTQPFFFTGKSTLILVSADSSPISPPWVPASSSRYTLRSYSSLVSIFLKKKHKHFFFYFSMRNYVWFFLQDIIQFLIIFSLIFFCETVELRKQISCSLQLSNKSDNYVAFKVLIFFHLFLWFFF